MSSTVALRLVVRSSVGIAEITYFRDSGVVVDGVIKSGCVNLVSHREKGFPKVE